MNVAATAGSREIGVLLAKAYQFKEKLNGLRASLATPDFEWYPHDTLSNLEHFERLLTGDNRRILETMNGVVADIGCQDGDLAFFLESIGLRVQAIDNPLTDHNHMCAVRTLRQALGSAVEIYEVDLDTQFFLPENSYDAVFLLGVLYHLKNPFYVLESLSKQARYCFLSTRIAALTPDHSIRMAGQALAYLPTESELNNDSSNYWIFSDASLRRMLGRTNWEILDWLTIGAVGESDPVDRDERCFCLLKSRFGRIGAVSSQAQIALGVGWHGPEDRGWRWTERCFSATASLQGRELSRLRMKLHLPAPLLEVRNSLTLSARVNGVPLRPETYARAGDAEFVRGFSPEREVVAEFELDGAIGADASDPRERGIIVASLEFQ